MATRRVFAAGALNALFMGGIARPSRAQQFPKTFCR